jgi:hypothetical protein
MIRRLKEQFALGFREGWAMFWSPFTAPVRQMRASWAAHVGAARGTAREA